MQNLYRLKKSLWYYYCICILSVFFLHFVSVEIQLLLYTILILLCLVLTRSDGILHPLSWFPLFYYLYGISFVAYSLLQNNYHPHLDKLIPLSFIGFIGFLTPLIFVKKNVAIAPTVYFKDYTIKFLWIICICFAIFLIYFVLNQGFISKRDFLDNIGTLSRFFIVFTIIPIIYCVYIIKHKKINIFRPFFLITLSVLLISFGATGERDYIFKFGFFLFLIYYSIRPYKLSVFIILIFLAIFIMPVTQALKGYLLDTTSLNYQYNFHLSDLFYNDFYAAGRTLNYILDKNLPLLHGETFYWDVKRFFNFFFPDQLSTGAWFNEVLRAKYNDKGNSGWGFSLVAEGYINFSKVGVFFLYFIIGVISGLIYKVSHRNIFYYLYYLLYIVTCIYVTRADLANYLSLNFKVNMIIILLIFILLKLFNINTFKVNK